VGVRSPRAVPFPDRCGGSELGFDRTRQIA